MKPSRIRTVSSCTRDRQYRPPNPTLCMSLAAAYGIPDGSTTMMRLSRMSVLGPLGGLPEAMDGIRR